MNISRRCRDSGSRLSTRLALLSTVFLLAAGASGDDIERVEPPFWWQGFEHSELQLLVYGDNMSAFQPAMNYDGVTIRRVERVDSPNYLFVYLQIDASARPGSFEIGFHRDGETRTHSYELRRREADAGRNRGFSSADVIYLVTPDRFANGDPANDAVEGYGDVPDRSEPFGRHGGDLRGVSQHLDYIADMGFTQIWLNPVLENRMPKASYHGYATTDFYRVDPRFGSNEEYRRLVADARARGVGNIMDMIVNHCGSGHWWMQDLPSADWLNSPDEFRATTHLRTANQDPYASRFDKKAFANGWFVQTMPDLNQRNGLLGDYLVQNAIWWTEYLGLAGIRMDTYSYPDKDYMSEWTRRIMQEYPDFNIVGEEWSINPAIVSYWQRGKKNHDGYVSSLPSLMDFPVQETFAGVLLADEPDWGSVWTPLYEITGNDFLYPEPQNLVIFPDNHDMSRIYTQLGEDLDLYRIALAYYLTMRGIPQIYYGTEVLLSHPGTDSHGAIREDMPGGFPGDKRNAFTGEGLSRDALGAQAYLRKLLQWRKGAAVIHSGALMQFAPIGNVYAYFRYDDATTVMVVLYRGDVAQSLDLTRFAERIGDQAQATDVVTGRRVNLSGALQLDPRSALILQWSH